MDVVGATQGEMDHAGADGGPRQPVDQNKGAQFAIDCIGLEGHVLTQGQVADADVVQVQGARGQLFLGVDVHPMANVGDLGGDGAGADLQIIDAAGDQFGLSHPDDGGLELVGGLQRRIGGGQNIAARHVDLVGEGQGDGLASLGAVQIAAHDDDPLHARADAGGRDGDGVAHRDGAAVDAARIAAEVEVGAVDALDRHAEGAGGLGGGWQGFQ
ncbi:hypothetical protein D3C85_800910 [compost metagenome]